jgi:hypothetical protein
LAAVDGVLEFPASERLPPVRRSGAILRMAAGERSVAVPARCDGAGDHALALAVALHRRPKFFDYADRLVADRQAPTVPATHL